MNGLWAVFLMITGAVVSCFILYMVIKAAVRDGILEARQAPTAFDKPDTVTKITCPDCGKRHEMDFPKCPHCVRVNFEL